MFATLHGLRYFAVFTAGMLLLYALAFLIGVRLRALLSQGRVERFFAGRTGLRGNLAAAVLGAVTPFCSCTTVPVFAGMLESEVGLGPAMSFLIASPTVNPPGLVLLFTLFGATATLVYVAAVLVAAVAGGWLLGQRRLAGYVHEVFLLDAGGGSPGLRETLAALLRFLRGFAVVILAAAAAATLLKSWTPSEATVAGFARLGVAAVPSVVLFGMLVYGDFILLLPLAHTLLLKGVPQGTVFAFVMAASGVGPPSLILLSRLVHRRLILHYVGVLAALLVLLGWAMNGVLA